MKDYRSIGLLKNERGMTMVELVFASVVLLGAIVIMLSMFETAINIFNFTVSRSVATQLATEQIENIRSMDYQQVYNTLPATWPADPDLVTSSTPPLYNDVDDDGNPIQRQIVTTTTATGLTMERLVVRNRINFTVRTYALWVDDASTTQAFKRLVTKVSWVKPATPGEVVLTTNYTQEDGEQPRPSVSIVGVRSTNFNYFKGASEDTTMGLDDSIRGPLDQAGTDNDASTPVVRVVARANSGKASGIDRVEFTVYDPDGDVVSVVGSGVVTSAQVDAQGFYSWGLNTTGGYTPDAVGYLIKATAFDNLSNSDVSTMRVNIDNTMPAMPSDFETYDVAGSAYRLRVTWAWTAAVGDQVPFINRFVLRRKRSIDASFSQAAAMPTTSREFLDSGLSTGYTYRYRLKIVDTAGNTTQTPEVERVKVLGTASDTVAPLAVTTDSAAATNWKAVDISWWPTTDAVGVLAYNWIASDDAVNWTVIGQTTETVGDPYLYFQDTGLKPGKVYGYKPYSFDNEGNVSLAGTTVWATTPQR